MEHPYKYYRARDRRELQDLLRDNGFYSTEGRLQLLSLLKRSHSAWTVPEVAHKLGRKLDEVNIYRSLEALCGKGIVARSDMRDGFVRYEFGAQHHHHLVCNSCGTSEDMGDCSDKQMEQAVLKKSKVFAAISTHALEFFGTCRSCAHSV